MGRLSLSFSSLVEELLREDVLGNEDDGSQKSMDNTNKLSTIGRFARAGQHDAECERDQRQVRRLGVPNVVHDSISENGKEG